MDEKELIQKLKEQNANLEKALTDALTNKTKLADVLGNFKAEAAPGIEAIHKTIEQLQNFQKGFENVTKLLSKMDPKDIEALMKKK